MVDPPKIDGRETCRFTISMGFAVMTPEKGAAADREALLEAADRAMYSAKTGGRDRFQILHVGAN